MFVGGGQARGKRVGRSVHDSYKSVPPHHPWKLIGRDLFEVLALLEAWSLGHYPETPVAGLDPERKPVFARDHARNKESVPWFDSIELDRDLVWRIWTSSYFCGTLWKELQIQKATLHSNSC
jgi:hypothetical protein